MGITKVLDDVQWQAFSKIHDIAQLDLLRQHDIVESEKMELIRDVTQLIVNYSDYLKIFKSNITSEKERADYALYENKLQYIRKRVKDVQLHSHKLDLEHQQRLRIERFKPKDAATLDSQKQKLFEGRSQGKGEKDIATDSTEDQILNQNKKITSNLQATRQLLAGSILQTELNTETLDQQTKDLGDLNEQLFKLSDLFVKASQIVKFIERQDKNDKRRIYLSIYFFMACITWVIWRRFFRTPTKAFIWTITKSFGLVSWLLPRSETPEALSSSDSVVSTIVTALTVATAAFFSSVSEAPAVSIAEAASLPSASEGSFHTQTLSTDMADDDFTSVEIPLSMESEIIIELESGIQDLEDGIPIELETFEDETIESTESSTEFPAESTTTESTTSTTTESIIESIIESTAESATESTTSEPMTESTSEPATESTAESSTESTASEPSSESSEPLIHDEL